MIDSAHEPALASADTLESGTSATAMLVAAIARIAAGAQRNGVVNTDVTTTKMNVTSQRSPNRSEVAIASATIAANSARSTPWRRGDTDARGVAAPG